MDFANVIAFAGGVVESKAAFATLALAWGALNYHERTEKEKTCAKEREKWVQAMDSLTNALESIERRL